MTEPHATSGRVSSIRRHPVKSMGGEALDAVEVTASGLLGDRALALIDADTGKVVSAKNPRRWPGLLDYRAAYLEPPRAGGPTAAVEVTLPDGARLALDGPGAEAVLSERLGRPVRLARAAVEGATAEGYWPDHDWLEARDEVFEFPLPPGTFFDGASVHLLTTATLDRLRELLPSSRIEVERFRPNFVIETDDAPGGFVEDGWIGRTLALGGALLRVDGPCPRCVMTTLAQGGLPDDPAVLRAAVRANGGNVGVYATVLRAGPVRLGDPVAPA